MSEWRFSTFDKTLDKTNRVLKEIESAYGWPKERRNQSYEVLRVVLHTLRDRLTIDEAAQLGAQLPLLIRGVYYEGWDPSRVPQKMDREEFLRRVRQNVRYRIEGGTEHLVRVVLQALRHYVSEGEWADVRSSVPADVRAVIPA